MYLPNTIRILSTVSTHLFIFLATKKLLHPIKPSLFNVCINRRIVKNIYQVLTKLVTDHPLMRFIVWSVSRHPVTNQPNCVDGKFVSSSPPLKRTTLEIILLVSTQVQARRRCSCEWSEQLFHHWRQFRVWPYYRLNYA